MSDELRAAAEECRELHREITGRLYERSEQNLREMPLVMVPTSLVKRLEMALPTLTEHILASQPDDPEPVTVEQHCRDLLEIAVRDRLVECDVDVQQHTSGELAGMANKLQEILRSR